MRWKVHDWYLQMLTRNVWSVHFLHCVDIENSAQRFIKIEYFLRFSFRRLTDGLLKHWWALSYTSCFIIQISLYLAVATVSSRWESYCVENVFSNKVKHRWLNEWTIYCVHSCNVSFMYKDQSESESVCRSVVSALCKPTDYSSPGFSVQEILQARILEWVDFSFSRGSFWPRHWTQVSCIAGRFFTQGPKKVDK